MVLQTLPTRNANYKIQFGMKIRAGKSPIPHVVWIKKTRGEGGKKPYEQPFTGEGAFWLRENIYSNIYTDLHIMPFEKIRVPNRGFNTYLPVGSSVCNGHISGVRARMSE